MCSIQNVLLLVWIVLETTDPSQWTKLSVALKWWRRKLSCSYFRLAILQRTFAHVEKGGVWIQMEIAICRTINNYYTKAVMTMPCSLDYNRFVTTRKRDLLMAQKHISLQLSGEVDVLCYILAQLIRTVCQSSEQESRLQLELCSREKKKKIK